MYVNKPFLVGSDPEASVAIPQQFVSVDFAFREQSVAVSRAMEGKSVELVCYEFLESTSTHAHYQMAVPRNCQIAHSR